MQTEMAIQLQDTFRHNLRRRLHELGMSQRDMARTMNVSDAYISQLLNHDYTLTLGTVEKIAKILSTNSLYLLTPVVPESIPEKLRFTSKSG